MKDVEPLVDAALASAGAGSSAQPAGGDAEELRTTKAALAVAEEALRKERRRSAEAESRAWVEAALQNEEELKAVEEAHAQTLRALVAGHAAALDAAAAAHAHATSDAAARHARELDELRRELAASREGAAAEDRSHAEQLLAMEAARLEELARIDAVVSSQIDELDVAHRAELGRVRGELDEARGALGEAAAHHEAAVAAAVRDHEEAIAALEIARREERGRHAAELRAASQPRDAIDPPTAPTSADVQRPPRLPSSSRVATPPPAEDESSSVRRRRTGYSLTMPRVARPAPKVPSSPRLPAALLAGARAPERREVELSTRPPPHLLATEDASAEADGSDAAASGSATRRPPATRIALVVGASDALLARCRLAAQTATLTIERCDLASVGTSAAHLRPSIIMMTEDLYRFDPDEFAALARDIHSSLIILPNEGVPVAEIYRQLATAVPA